jgi:O-antigen/teichoic acid export membrane protein
MRVANYGCRPRTRIRGRYAHGQQMPVSSAADPEDAIDEQEHVLDAKHIGRRYIRGSAVRIGAYLVSVLMSIGSVPLVTRHLGKAGFGEFATASSIVFIIGGFSEAGLNAYGVREYASGRVDKDRMLRNLVGLRVSMTGFAVLCVAGVAALIGVEKVIIYGILISGGGLMATITGENFGIPISAELRLTTASILSVIQQFILCTGYVVLVVIGAGVLPFLAVTAASGAGLLLSTAVVTRGSVSSVPLFDRRIWKDILKQTLPYAAAAAVGIIYFREALVLTSALAHSDPKAQAGLYSAAFRIVEVLTMMPYYLVMAGFPILARAVYKGDHGRIGYALQRFVDMGWLLGAWVVVSVFFGAKFGILVIGGHGYKAAAPVLQIQGLSVLASFMVAIYSSVLLSLRDARELVKANAIAVLVATVVSLVLIPGMGAKGAAIAAVAAETSLAIAYAVFLHRTRPDLRVSLAILPRVALATLVSGLITWVLPLSSAERLFVFTALYFGMSLALRTIPFEVLNAFLRRAPQ